MNQIKHSDTPNVQYEISDPAVMALTPLVSVKMITYNHGPYLAEAIEGVIAQKTDFPIELIIGEDCSTDNTREIALDYQRRYPQLIRVIYSDRNVGMIANGLRVMAACRGEFIAVCEGDDYWTNPDKLRLQVDFLMKNPDYSMCYHRYMKLRRDGRIIQSAEPKYDSLTLEEYAKLLIQPDIQTMTVVYRNLIHPLIPDNMMDKAVDQFIFIRLAEIGKLKYINEIMATYRIHDGGIFSGKSKFQQVLMVLQNLEAVIEYFASNSTICSLFKKRYTDVSLRRARYFLVKFSLFKWMYFINRATKYDTHPKRFTYLIRTLQFRYSFTKALSKLVSFIRQKM